MTDAVLPDASADDLSGTSPASTASDRTSPVGIPRIGLAPVTAPTPRPTPAVRSHTLLVDSQPRRLRRAEDLLDLVLAVVGALATIVLAIYAHETTTGVTQDVQNVLTTVLRQILVLPLQAVEGLATFLIPVTVLLTRLFQGSWRSALQGALGALGGWFAGLFIYQMLVTWAPEALVAGLTVTASGTAQIGVSAIFAALAGLLTGAGDRRTSTTVRVAWGVVWVIVGLTVLRSALTLPGALLSVLIGRAVGILVRLALGVDDRRAHGVALIRALRRAGVDAVRVVRMDPAPDPRAWTVTTDAPLGYTERVRETPLAAPVDLSPPPDTAGTPDADAAVGPSAHPAPAPAAEGEAAPPSSRPPHQAPIHTESANTIAPADDVETAAALAEAHSSALTEGRPSVHRVYAVWDSQGVRRDVTVLDADRQVAGFLAGLWDRVRVRGLSPTRDLSVRPAAEHAVLMTLEARRVGVRTPALLGLAEAQESVILVTEHVADARSFDALGSDVPEAVLDQLWEQVAAAHASGLAHRELDGSHVVVDAREQVWLLDWDSGETASNEISRRVDLAQALALIASAVGVERAIASASRALSTQQLASIAPMLQKVVLPDSTRQAMGRRGTVLQELRDALVALTPTAHAEPARLTRFSTRTVIMAVVALAALWTLLARMNLEQISEAVRQANAWWILAALIFSLATYVGAGLALVAFSPVRLGVLRSTEVHLASSVVSLVAPAGVGGAAINLRFLARKGVPTAIGVATVALVQVVQFAVTVLLLVLLAALTGRSTGLTLPSGWIMLAAVVLVAAVAAALLIPRVRSFLWDKIEPTYRQVWPRVVWILSNPRRLALGVGGTLLLSLSYVLAFGASLWAFGYTLPFSVLAITYLASNTVGSVVPSPGGIGPVEIALTAGLVASGIPSGVALSAAIVYRLVTFWIPIPVGWLSLQRLQREGDL
ncbi:MULTISPECIES: lysylphosphatidylglycerol synthase transmembrane domain-containing protein [Actinomyces]|uniref:Flippase-like domain-containing protein n=1 Tax=Actinomyces respiraculi TaxID=2744574 RepID=A0A7T0LL62_9ACTO|nr:MULTISPECIES: lysylphosphatidylglycerol synthase transmembrane domain-containing protein [Actinomyces]QPL05471.1 flippase-like domain-containing protein [Actinomyces respiraculi]